MLNQQAYPVEDGDFYYLFVKNILIPTQFGLSLTDRRLFQVLGRNLGSFLKKREEHYEEYLKTQVNGTKFRFKELS